MSEQQFGEVNSIEQLISALEHIEESELKSDIRPNVRAELKRIKRNVSAILAFTSYTRSLRIEDSTLREAIVSLRRECLEINSTISRYLILQALHADTWTEYSSRVSEQYEAMATAAQQMCALLAPLRVPELTSAL